MDRLKKFILGLMVSVFFIALFQVSLVSAQVNSYIYDNFDDSIINTDLWEISGPAYETNGKIILYTDTRITALNRNLIGMWFSAIGHQNISAGDHVNISVGTSFPDGSEISAGIIFDDNRIENKSVVFCQWRDQYGVFEWADLQPAQWGDTYTFGLEYTSDSSILGYFKTSDYEPIKLGEKLDYLGEVREERYLLPIRELKYTSENWLNFLKETGLK